MSQVVIFDTEYTSWEKASPYWSDSGQHRELIQIGAIKLTRGEGWQKASVFDVVVKPVINPKLSAFIIKLTGVTQQRVDNEGCDTLTALRMFKEFIGDAVPVSNGGDINVIAETCGHQGVVTPLDSRKFMSLRMAMYAALEKELGHEIVIKDWPSGKVYQLLGLELPTAQVHNALHDVYSLAAVCCELEQRGHEVLPWPKN